MLNLKYPESLGHYENIKSKNNWKRNEKNPKTKKIFSKKKRCLPKYKKHTEQNRLKHKGKFP